MANSLSLNSEFVGLVNQIQKAPANLALQMQLARQLPQVKQLARDNPLLMFHLAKIYPPKSPEYRNTIRLSANMGCTNAMLALCQLLVTTGQTADMQTAVHYMKRIVQSKDTHIIDLAQSFLAQHPQLAAAMQVQATKAKSHGFFKPEPRTMANEVASASEMTP